MADLPYKGGGILMPYQPEPHLFAIMNDPCPSRLCLVVMVTTIYEGRSYDPACVLHEGEHPFIKHDSYVLYRRASQVRAVQIQNMIGQKYYIPKEDFDSLIFQRIVDGLFASEDAKPWAVRYAESCGL